MSAGEEEEIWVITFHGQGHLLPSFELCNQLLSRKLRTTLFISAAVSSSVPPSLAAEYPPLPPPPPMEGDRHTDDGFDHRQLERVQMSECLRGRIATRRVRPVCAIVDHLVSWVGLILDEMEVPAVGFFTSGACSTAMEYALWKAELGDSGVGAGETRLLPGLPEHMAVTELDLKRRPFGPHGRRGPPGQDSGMGPHRPGELPHWFRDIDGFSQFLYNTCDDLEGPFIEYLNHVFEKQVRAVGPLLPAQYWKSGGSLFRDQQVRVERKSSIKEDEVIKWLDSKPTGSVLYVSFGSEVGPTPEEYSRLANALEASNKSFIWAIQLPQSKQFGPGDGSNGFYPHGLDKRVNGRGLIIHGWAPQLLILSHASTAAFLSHCGWNSTVEAIMRGVPILAWPIRGDQYHNAKLVVKHWRAGTMVTEDMSKIVEEDEIREGVEIIMKDDEVKKNALAICAKLEDGFPVSSQDALNAFKDSILNPYN
ncbi:Scopoletin glucosyltransferase [Linum grandiflorum]